MTYQLNCSSFYTLSNAFALSIGRHIYAFVLLFLRTNIGFLFSVSLRKCHSSGHNSGLILLGARLISISMIFRNMAHYADCSVDNSFDHSSLGNAKKRDQLGYSGIPSLFYIFFVISAITIRNTGSNIFM